MALNAFIPELWAATILRTLENNLVATKICNTEYTGEIKKHGDTVHFGQLADVTIGTYAGSITYEELNGTDIPVPVDQQDYFAFKVSDIDAAQANVALQSSQAARAAYQLRDKCDKYILGLYAQAGKTITNTAVNSVNVFEAISDMSLALDEANVPNESKWIVIPPWVKHKLLLAGVKFGVKNGIDGQNGVDWTKELGFDLYVSNNVALASGASCCLGGSKNAIAFADQVTNTRAMDLEDSFDVGVSGLHLFGAKTIKADELVCGKLTKAAEPTDI